MTERSELLGGVAAMLSVLVVGAVFGRLHGAKGGSVEALGDRVACGLLAVPLISVTVRLAFPGATLPIELAAPLPLLLYTGLLAGVDAKIGFIQRRFTAILFVGSAALYFIAGAWLCLAGAGPGSG